MKPFYLALVLIIKNLKEILKIIDSITLEEYARRLGDPEKFFQNSKYKTQNSEALKKLAKKYLQEVNL